MSAAGSGAVVYETRRAGRGSAPAPQSSIGIERKTGPRGGCTSCCACSRGTMDRTATQPSRASGDTVGLSIPGVSASASSILADGRS